MKFFEHQKDMLFWMWFKKWIDSTLYWRILIFRVYAHISNAHSQMCAKFNNNPREKENNDIFPYARKRFYLPRPCQRMKNFYENFPVIRKKCFSILFLFIHEIYGQYYKTYTVEREKNKWVYSFPRKGF